MDRQNTIKVEKNLKYMYLEKDIKIMIIPIFKIKRK